MSLLDELKTLVNNRTDENSALYSEVKKQLGVPMLGLRTSTLGGKERPSLNINLSLEAKENWKNGIFQNSSYAQFMLNHDGSMELISMGSGMPKFHKAKIKSIGDAFAKIKKYVEAAKNADTANADTVDEAKIAPLDNVTISDLVLFMDNESTIHDAANQYLKGLKRYLKRGKFDENRALDGWVNIVKMAAAKYNKEFGSSIRMGGEDALKIAKAYVKNNKEWIDDALADTANADTAAYPKADSDYFTIWVQEDDKQYGMESGFRKLSEAKDEWQDVRDHYKRVRIVKFKYSTNPRDKSVYAAISELLADADTRKLPLSKVLSYGYADKASDTAANVNYVIMMYGVDNKSGSKMPAWFYGGCKDSEAAAVAFADKVSGYYPVLVKVAMKPEKKHEGALVRAFNKSGTKPISTLRTFAVVNGKIQKVTDTADTAKMPQGTEHYLMYKTHDGPVCYDAYSSMKDVNKNRKGAAALSTDGQSYVVQAKSVNEAKRKMSGGDDTASLTPASGAFGIAGVSFPMHSANAAIMIGKREADYLVKAASEAGMEAYMVVTPQKNKPDWEPLVSCVAYPRGVKSVASNVRVTFSEHGPIEIYNTTTNRTLKGFKHGQVINVAGWEAKKTKVAEIFDSITANSDVANAKQDFRRIPDNIMKGDVLDWLTRHQPVTFRVKAYPNRISELKFSVYAYDTEGYRWLISKYKTSEDAIAAVKKWGFTPVTTDVANADTAAFRGFTDVKGSDEHLTYAEGLTFEFKAKAKVVSDGGVDRYYYVMPKELKTGNVDMSAFRKSKAWGPFANSNMFEQMIMPLVHRQGKKSWSAKTEQRIIYTDNLPTGCVVNKGKLLDTITLRIPDNYRLGKSSDTANDEVAAHIAKHPYTTRDTANDASVTIGERFTDGYKGYNRGANQGYTLMIGDKEYPVFYTPKTEKVGGQFGSNGRRTRTYPLGGKQIMIVQGQGINGETANVLIKEVHKSSLDEMKAWLIANADKMDKAAATAWQKGIFRYQDGGYAFGFMRGDIALKKNEIAKVIVAEAKKRKLGNWKVSDIAFGTLMKRKDNPDQIVATFFANAPDALGKEIINQIESGNAERKRMLRSLRNRKDTAALEWTKGLSKHPSSGGYVFGLENSAIAINKGTIATLVVIEAKSKFGMTIEPSQVSIGIIAKMKDDPSKARAYVGINAKGAKGKPTATGILA